MGTLPVNRKVESKVWDDLFSYFHQDPDLPVIAPLCQQVFEEAMTSEQRDPYPELSHLDTLQELRTVFERRDDLQLAVTWVRQIIHTFENPAEGAVVRSVSSDLQVWYNDHKTSQPEEIKPEKKSPGYLLIALDPKDDENTVALTAELHAPDGVIKTDLLPPDVKCSVDEPYDDLSRYLSKAVRKARRVKTIEFFLSWRHFDRPVHEWEVIVDLDVLKQLKVFRNTLVRSLDRLTEEDVVDEWLESLQEQLTRLQDCCDAELVSYCHTVAKLNCDKLQGDLPEGSDYLILKLLSALPKDQNDLRKLKSIVLWSGIPLWFWSYAPPTDPAQFSKKIDDLLSANNLQDSETFAEVIRKKRSTLPHLGLLCDCPTRLPVLVDWKNGRLRQPAVESPMSA